MNFDPAQIEEFFPWKEFRPGQRECIEAILNAFNDGKKFVVLEAPTGSGKSVIGMTVSKFFQNSYYLTIQKILQDQLTKDFSNDFTKSLKGRNAYKCDYWLKFYEKHRDNPAQMNIMRKAAKDPVLAKTVNDPNLSCDNGYCIVADGKGKAPLCFPKGISPQKDEPLSKHYKGSTCPYWLALGDAMESQIAILNFHSFLYQSAIADRFKHRGLLVIDEAHNTEPQLMDFVSLSLTDRRFRADGITFPQFNTAEEYAQYFEEIDLAALITEQVRILTYARRFNEADEWRKAAFQLTLFQNSVSSGEWIPKFEEKRGYNKITLKPIYINRHAGSYLFDKADKVLLMSATILLPKVMYDSLGIDPKDAFAYRMKNRFPLDNRPIYFQPSGSMSFKNKTETMPRMLDDIEKIAAEHSDQRGIIHTHNFEIAKYIMERASKTLKPRLLYQENFQKKEDMLKEHENTPNGILVAPALHEGLDLKGDLGRFQIICKVPYPSFKDNEQLQIRMQVSEDYYSWLTALKIVQSYGRCIRSESDWANTYVLDADFEQFKRKNHKMLPGWFTEAIQSK